MSMINEFVEKLIERLKKGQYDMIKPYAGNYLASTMIAALDIAIKIIKELAEEYKDVPDINAGKWISCEERLPEIFEDTKSSEVVLIYGYDKHNDYSWQAMGFYVEAESIKRWFLADCKNTEKPIDWIDIIAWQPLPQPYKGE